MLNDIKMGIADKLSGISQATIYTEKVPQGFNEPCFLLWCPPLTSQKTQVEGINWITT